MPAIIYANVIWSSSTRISVVVECYRAFQRGVWWEAEPPVFSLTVHFHGADLSHPLDNIVVDQPLVVRRKSGFDFRPGAGFVGGMDCGQGNEGNFCGFHVERRGIKKHMVMRSFAAQKGSVW